MAAKQEHFFSITNGKLQKYYGPGGDLVVPEGVSSIDSWAFKDRKTVTSVIIPEGVKEVGEGAFWRCNGLASVTIPDSVDRIGDDAFHGCKSLISVTIPKKVTSIGSHTFYNCNSLTSVTFLGEIKSIGNLAFRNCFKIRSVTIPHWVPDLKVLLENGFMSLCCAEDSISEIPTYYRTHALLGFVNKSNTDMDSELAKSYLKYAKRNAAKLLPFAFQYQELLQFMCEQGLIPAKEYDAYLKEAEKRENTELKAVLLGYLGTVGVESVSDARKNNEKVKDSYADALAGRISLRDPSEGIKGMTFVIAGRVKKDYWSEWSSQSLKEYLESYGAHLASTVTKNTDYLVTYSAGKDQNKHRKAQEYGVLEISKAEFQEMIGLRYKDAKSVVIPSWIRKIPGDAFSGCHSLTNVIIPDGVTAIGAGAFMDCNNLMSIEIPIGVTSIESNTFMNCRALKNVTIPDGVTAIKEFAFKDCCSLTSILIPAGVTSIDSSAFFGCANLMEVTIPDTVTSIGMDAFFGTAVFLDRKRWEYSVLYIDKHLIKAEKTLEGSYKIQSETYSISKNAFRDCTKLTDVTIPGSVSSIGSFTFGDCISLTSVTIADGVKSIGYCAFEGCSNLKSIRIPVSVMNIGSSAFSECSGLTIYSESGSFAEKYAKENNIPFVAE